MQKGVIVTGFWKNIAITVFFGILKNSVVFRVLYGDLDDKLLHWIERIVALEALPGEKEDVTHFLSVVRKHSLTCRFDVSVLLTRQQGQHAKRPMPALWKCS